MLTTIELRIPAERILERVYALTALQSYSHGNFGDPLRRTPGREQRPALLRALHGAGVNLGVALMRHLDDFSLSETGEVSMKVRVESADGSVSAVTSTMLLAMVEEALAYGVMELCAPVDDSDCGRTTWGNRTEGVTARLLAMLEPATGLSLTPQW
ncbi:MAG: hypothetical protein NC187_05880 [Candidatus Amulumruptor caecigallinarius]|nr:hypothetical protein [Candidatus Amulumruptor caecigallinarius]MCM1396999.1 hypothetical protein [Candidatus Amulumruptor caecigallinarius]MCM1454643.1 hypothetical protein [bacterium]